MIISHKYQFIFIKSRKTAGSSLEIALSKYLGVQDVITPCMPIEEESIRKALGYRGAQNFKLPLRRWKTHDALDFIRGHPPKRFSSHSNAAHINREIGRDLLRRYTVVLAVRNPFEYVVSLYKWHSRAGERSVAGFRKWLIRGEGDLRFSNWGMGKVNGESVVDLALRFENLPASIAELCERTGLPEELLDTFNNISAKSSPTIETLTPADAFRDFPEGLAMVQERFSEEIGLFGYRFDPRA